MLIVACVAVNAAAIAALWPPLGTSGGGSVDALRAAGGIACLTGIAIAGVTAACWRTDGHVRFISEVLAAWGRQTDPAPRTVRLGSGIASAVTAAGAVLYAAGAWRGGGTTAIPGVATGVLLLLVVWVRLADEPHPLTSPWRHFDHPGVAAAFYLAAVILSWTVAPHTGELGWWLAALHVVTSQALMLTALVGSLLLYGVRGLTPLPGLRILLDVRRGNYAGCVRGFQWPATFCVGVALCASALGW